MPNDETEITPEGSVVPVYLNPDDETERATAAAAEPPGPNEVMAARAALRTSAIKKLTQNKALTTEEAALMLGS